MLFSTQKKRLPKAAVSLDITARIELENIRKDIRHDLKNPYKTWAFPIGNTNKHREYIFLNNKNIANSFLRIPFDIISTGQRASSWPAFCGI